MQSIPFIGGNERPRNRVQSLLNSSLAHPVKLETIGSLQAAMDYLSIEMPELMFVDFSDAAVDGFALLHWMMDDPWLLHGSVVALGKDSECTKKVEEIRGANVVAALTYDEVDYYLVKIIDIVMSNRRILFQREIGADFVQAISASFKLENDLVVASCYANLVSNFLFNTGRLDMDSRLRANLALSEMLVNAMEHGNCGITYEEKSQWLAQGKDISELIALKCTDEAIRRRRVTFEYSIGLERSHFLIADEGAGFDWRNIKDARSEENIFKLHGRGILVTQQIVQNLQYSERGNEVRFDIVYPPQTVGVTPALFERVEPRNIEAGETIFRQGEASNFLYYIAKGHYDVIVGDTIVSELTPDDIFMGEMSFLLNNRRSATVRARTPGMLFAISKKQFVEAIKRKPHYALFLCRLLAQRIQRANARRAARNEITQPLGSEEPCSTQANGTELSTGDRQ